MGFGGWGQPPTAPTPLGSSLVMCGLNRFSSESSQQTWQEGSPLPQPENAKNPTGKMAVWNTPAGHCRTVPSKAEHHSISVPPELPDSGQSLPCWAGTAKDHRQACHSEPRTRPETQRGFISAKKPGSGSGRTNDILLARKGKRKRFWRLLSDLSFYFASHVNLSHYNHF